jgi:hypothetical protein
MLVNIEDLKVRSHKPREEKFRRSYNPNSQGLWDNQPEYAEPSLALEGNADH